MKVRITAVITFKKGITVGVHPMLKTVSHGDDGKKAEYSQAANSSGRVGN